MPIVTKKRKGSIIERVYLLWQALMSEHNQYANRVQLTYPKSTKDYEIL